MSLDWDITEIKNHNEICKIDIEGDGTYVLHAVTHAMIYNTMAIDIGHITEKNWEEVYRRSIIFDLATGRGPLIDNKTKENISFTPEDIRNHIGLRTNVIDKPLGQFKTKVFSIMVDTANRKLRNYEEEQTNVS